MIPKVERSFIALISAKPTALNRHENIISISTYGVIGLLAVITNKPL